ncbi:DNA repair and recombination protein RAD54 [Kluyveromyces marxianus]|nr:DNA repair and recombination protein RAD54 [Kluyveromyces marxianus]
MARPRLPDRPPNGIGAGARPSLRPRRLEPNQSLATLTKPFKVPFKVNKTDHAKRYGVRSSRRAHTTYANMDLSLDADTKVKRKDALSLSRLNADPSRLDTISSTLRRSFTVPIKGYVPRHNIPLALGTKAKIVIPPRPLHDPTDELAIVLYDPSVDGDIPEQHEDMESFRQSMVEKKPTPSGKGKNTTNSDPEAQQTQASGAGAAATPKSKESSPGASFHHPRMLSNGVKNKSLRELLGSADGQEKKKFPNVPVVIDPKLAKILRPHQVEGVRFLYRCVTGLVMKDFLDAKTVLDGNLKLSDTDEESKPNKESSDAAPAATTTTSSVAPSLKDVIKVDENSRNRGAYGCIMADEMGLGKTLQCLALMWTMLKQGPQGRRSIDKCIIVCPSSLVNNWANEIVKWLGPGSLSPLAVDGKKSNLNNGSVADAIKQWALAQGRNIVKPVLIISYETLRRNVEFLKNCEVGLMLADEGHRLKNADSLTFTSLDSIKCPRRVILSGTPIQNDLSEYFALLNFSNPGLLGSRNDFRKNFELPILQSRDSLATEEEVALGKERLKQLSNIVSKFIIRRTNNILSKYLPCKYEHVIFINLTPFQKAVYKHFTESRAVKKLVKGDGNQPLKAIGLLKKLCNHPDLLELSEDIPGCEDLIPDDYQSSSLSTSSRHRSVVQTAYSSKFAVLERFLYKIKKESNDKIVLISNYTQTLDLIEKMCYSNHYGVLRLDGTMNINKRQKLVDRFNDPEGPEFIFLLSSKAGGCGINLIGANRLILLDPDWNPAADQQALARVWRDGQKKDCFIYRFISTGTIEEKIYQRQSMKMSLSSCVVDEKEDVERLFSSDNLKQLFTFDDNTICNTHETYNCKRCKNGKQMIKAPVMLYGDATSWNHLDHSALAKTNDHLLKNEHNYKDISFVFQYISH